MLSIINHLSYLKKFPYAYITKQYCIYYKT